MISLLFLGCLEPFPSDRHDLVDLRIVGMALAEGTRDFRAFAWEGSEAWSPVAPSVAWETTRLDCGGELCGALDIGLFSLSITGVDGASERGELAVEAGARVPSLVGYTRTLGEAGAEFSLDVPDAEAVHWMIPAGELMETAHDAATWTAPVDADGAPEPGIWPVVALWMDGLGGNDWATFDVPVGIEGPFLAIGGRLFPVDTALPAGPLTALVTVAPASNLTGFTLMDLAVDDGSASVDVACGVDGVDATSTWDPDSVIERRCGRDELAEVRVRVAGEIVP